MTPEKAIAFDVWSHFAFFRRHFTTTNASTHPFIPRSAVEGLVGAISGYRYDEYADLLWDAGIAVELRRMGGHDGTRISKMPFKLFYTHSDFGDRITAYLKGAGSLEHKQTPVSIELIREPKYRIYFSSAREGVYPKLLKSLRVHRTHYTPCLGSSSMIANFEFVDEYEMVESVASRGEGKRVVSIIPFVNGMPRIKPERGVQYAIEEDLSIHLDRNRKRTGSYSAVYSPVPGQSILADDATISTLRNEKEEVNVVFVPTTTGAA